MIEWLFSLIAAIVLLFLARSSREPLSDPAPRPAVKHQRKPVHVPLVKTEEIMRSPEGLKSALKSGPSKQKKSVVWSEKADFRAITDSGKIIDKAVKIH